MAEIITEDERNPDASTRYPRITPYRADADPRWPSGWAGEPTERDLVGMALDELFPDAGHPAVRTLAPRGAAVNLADYRAASLKGWGTGWPKCGGAAGNVVTVTADRSGARFNVHRRVAVLFDTLIDRMEARGYLCKPAQCGAYNCRAIGGTSSPSNHSWALAADINWTDNPYTTTGRKLMPLWVPNEVFKPYGWAWGGDYKGTKKDYMHVEFLGTPLQADEQTAKVKGETAAAPSTARTLRLIDPHMTGGDVLAVQKILAAWYRLPASFVDGDYGPATVTYVKRVQDDTPPSPRLLADGEVGPATRAKLGL